MPSSRLLGYDTTGITLVMLMKTKLKALTIRLCIILLNLLAPCFAANAQPIVINKTQDVDQIVDLLKHVTVYSSDAELPLNDNLMLIDDKLFSKNHALFSRKLTPHSNFYFRFEIISNLNNNHEVALIGMLGTYKLLAEVASIDGDTAQFVSDYSWNSMLFPNPKLI